jgi:predicted secreted Zn-dependent protease
MTCRILTLLIGIFWAVPSLWAAPSVKVTEHFYDVEGHKVRNLKKELHRKGKEATGGRHHALTQWTVRWNFHFRQMGPSCVLEALKTDLEITYQLPRWTDRESAPQDLIRKWDRYYAALKRHEDGHAAIGRRAAEEIDRELRKIVQPGGCNNFSNTVNTAANRILDLYKQEEKDYDDNTSHGRTQGAIFP